MASKKYRGLYITAAYPNLKSTLAQIEMAIKAGFEFIELGLPFSDPIADGPVISAASQKVLAGTWNLDLSLETIAPYAEQIDIYVMTYSNVLYAYGLEKFCLKYGGILKAVILPDLPLQMHSFLHERNFSIPIVPFVSLESTAADIAKLAMFAGGFVYIISVRGITGTSANYRLAALEDLSSKILQYTQIPRVVGFGVTSRVHVEEILSYADGFVVGSAAVRLQPDLESYSTYISKLIN